MVSEELKRVIERIKELKPSWEITALAFNWPRIVGHREIRSVAIRFRKGQQIITARYDERFDFDAFINLRGERYNFDACIKVEEEVTRYDDSAIIPVFDVSAKGVEEIDCVYDFIKDSIIEEYNYKKEKFDREREREREERERRKSNFWNS